MTTVPQFLAAAGRQPPLRAPYNFAPLNETVLETSWEGDPDHGKPHPRGVSGELVIDWTVETPLLVGGEDNNSPFQLGAGGPYAIPGASLRGMIRSVLEVLSYAHLDLYQNQRFSIRDYDAVTWQGVNNSTDGRPKPMKLADGRTKALYLPFGGWLQKDGNAYRLTLCNTAEVEISNLVTAISRAMPAAAMSAYNWNCTSLHDRHRALDAAGLSGIIDLGVIDNKALAGQQGTLVVAGLIKDAASATKKREPAFLDPPTRSTWVISEAAVKAFVEVQVKDAKSHRGPPEENWSFWEPKLEAGQRIPVFFRGRPAAAAHAIPAPTDFVMALTRLMRFPHKFTTRDVLESSQAPLSPTKLDFVQALFGGVPEEGVKGSSGRERAWRSRVRFGFALPHDGSRTPGPLPKARPAVTMKPRASFYPFYLRPKPTTNGETVTHPVDWSNPNARLAGRKRYPPRNHAREQLPQAPNDNRELINQLTFLHASADEPLVFRSTIRFHNLLPAELGGLVWAIRLGRPGGGEGRRLRHMLGRAKGFGYGQVKADIARSSIRPNIGGTGPSLEDCATRFENWVTAKPPRAGTAFAGLPEVTAFLALCDADLGAALGDALAFPQHGHDSEEAQRILEAYSTIKKRTACVPNDRHPDWRGGRAISRDPANDAFLFLPEYPLCR